MGRKDVIGHEGVIGVYRPLTQKCCLYDYQVLPHIGLLGRLDKMN